MDDTCGGRFSKPQYQYLMTVLLTLMLRRVPWALTGLLCQVANSRMGGILAPGSLFYFCLSPGEQAKLTPTWTSSTP